MHNLRIPTALTFGKPLSQVGYILFIYLSGENWDSGKDIISSDNEGSPSTGRFNN